MKICYLLFLVAVFVSCSSNFYTKNDFDGGTYSFETRDCADDFLEFEMITKEPNCIVIRTHGRCKEKGYVFSSNSDVSVAEDSIYLNIVLRHNFIGTKEEGSLSACECNQTHIFYFDSEINTKLPVAISYH